VDPLDDNDDSLLREHFDALRTDTLSRLRPAGALAARRSRAARLRRRALIGAVASVLVVFGSVGGYLLVGRSGSPRDVTAAVNSTVSPSDGRGAANRGAGPTRVGDGPGPVKSATAPPGPPGGPVPPGFQAESVTFISTSSVWALGYAPCLVTRPWSTCPAVVRSRDGGRTWAGVPAPGDAAYLGDIRFVNARDGWVVARTPLRTKDPGGVSGVLYATHDGGATWHRVASVPGAAEVEAAAGRVWVSTGPAADAGTGSGSATPPGSDPSPAPGHGVYWAAADSDSFAQVVGDAHGTGLVVQGHYAYVYGGVNDLLSIKDGTVTRRSLPCPVGYQASPVLAASADLSLAVVCAGMPAGPAQGKALFTSADGGATWTWASGTPDPSGYVTSLAATGSAIFLSGRGMPLMVSRDAGASWRTALSSPSGGGFGYVGFTDGVHGVALALDEPGAIYLTDDAGRTWAAHRFG
jgi:photosystem II stability/assembly factor-like uncharacterized protein